MGIDINQPSGADYLEMHTADGVDIRLPIAGIGSRSYAFLIDWHIRLILSLAWFMLSGLIFQGTDSISDFFLRFIDFHSAIPYVVLIPGLVIYFLYHPILEIVMHGQTPGKRIAGIKIVGNDGITPGVGQLLIRNIFRLLDSIPLFYLFGLVACLMTQKHVRIGDLAAGTVLIYADKLKSGALEEDINQNSEYDIRVVDTAKELVERWSSLDRQTRGELARKLLSGTKFESNQDELSDKDLRDALEHLYR